MNHPKKIILFDGNCNLCNSTVQKVIAFDKKEVFYFATLSSDYGQQLADTLKIDLQVINSIILYEPGVSYDIKSDAVIKIANECGGLWRLINIVLVLPKSIRDILYNFIAKNRYRWFGKNEHCMLPSDALKKRFLE